MARRAEEADGPGGGLVGGRAQPEISTGFQPGVSINKPDSAPEGAEGTRSVPGTSVTKASEHIGYT